MNRYENVGKVIRVTERFKNGNFRADVEVTCTNCGGERVFAHLKHVNNGVCFKCNGTGVIEISRVVMTLENREKANRMNQTKNEAKRKERQQQQEQFQRKQAQIEQQQQLQFKRNKEFTIKNAQYLRNLDNTKDSTFIQDLTSSMKHRPLNELNPKYKHEIADYLARKTFRRGTKDYENLYAKLLADLDEDYSVR